MLMRAHIHAHTHSHNHTQAHLRRLLSHLAPTRPPSGVELLLKRLAESGGCRREERKEAVVLASQRLAGGISSTEGAVCVCVCVCYLYVCPCRVPGS